MTHPLSIVRVRHLAKRVRMQPAYKIRRMVQADLRHELAHANAFTASLNAMLERANAVGQRLQAMAAANAPQAPDSSPTVH